MAHVRHEEWRHLVGNGGASEGLSGQCVSRIALPFPGYPAFYFLVMDQTQDLGDRLTEIGRRDILPHGLFRIHRLM